MDQMASQVSQGVAVCFLVYWVIAGVVSLLVFNGLTTYSNPKTKYGNRKTFFVRQALYFVFGGAFVPLLALGMLAVFPLSIFAENQEKKNLTPSKPEGTPNA